MNNRSFTNSAIKEKKFFRTPPILREMFRNSLLQKTEVTQLFYIFANTHQTYFAVDTVDYDVDICCPTANDKALGMVRLEKKKLFFAGTWSNRNLTLVIPGEITFFVEPNLLHIIRQTTSDYYGCPGTIQFHVYLFCDSHQAFSFRLISSV